MAHRLVVYTVLTGDVHALGDPFPPGCDGFDRVCFTTDPALRSDAWEVRLFDDHGLDPQRASRRPKCLPHRYLPEHEWSLYVDGRARFVVDPVRILDACAGRGDLVAFRHHRRASAHDEAEEVIRRGYDDERRVREQMDAYRAAGFPDDAGLFAGTMLLRRHHAPEVAAFGDAWYEHVLRYSRRDQLSFGFVAWRRRLAPAAFDGTLRANAYIEWPVVAETERVPADFDPEVYAWLNPQVARSGLSPRRHWVEQGRQQGLRYRRPPRELNRLANKYRSDKGDLYFNAHAYADIYEHYFAELRGKPIRLLEVGLLRHDVQARNPDGPYAEAPSLQMWREYFESATLVGLDIADFSAVPTILDCTIVRGNVENPDDLARAADAAGGPLDVVIDDASHASHHQQQVLAGLFGQVRAGGLFIVEDLHYQPKALEKAGIPKTRDILAAWAQGRVLPSDYLDAKAQAAMLEQVESVRLFDSFDRFGGKLRTDALAVIRKKSGLLGRLRRML
ncbi:MAG: DUF616 domain-containing protein [Alphaproteobacteria bacterium]|nr:DUF616 domain-containing protein [Alphaproteobacteria bacterium]